jgi:hypothetical protein
MQTYQDFVNHIKEKGLPEFISFGNDLGEDTYWKIAMQPPSG